MAVDEERVLLAVEALPLAAAVALRAFSVRAREPCVLSTLAAARVADASSAASAGLAFVVSRPTERVCSMIGGRGSRRQVLGVVSSSSSLSLP